MAKVTRNEVVTKKVTSYTLELSPTQAILLTGLLGRTVVPNTLYDVYSTMYDELTPNQQGVVEDLDRVWQNQLFKIRNEDVNQIESFLERE